MPVLTTPEHIPRRIGAWTLVERSDERTAWETHRTVPGGEYKNVISVTQQYGGWRVKYHYNIGVDNTSPGGWQYLDADDGRATYDDRERAERAAVGFCRLK